MPLDAMWEGKYQTFEKDGVKITAVQAYNKNHSKDECVGYVLEFDGVKVYCAGDTSTTEDMEKKIPKMKVDYAFLPIDGVYNMGPKEATYCAKRIKASRPWDTRLGRFCAMPEVRDSSISLPFARMIGRFVSMAATKPVTASIAL